MKMLFIKAHCLAIAKEQLEHAQYMPKIMHLFHALLCLVSIWYKMITHIPQDYFTVTGTIMRLPSNSETFLKSMSE